MKANGWIIGIAGLWILIGALFELSPQIILWSNIFCGAIIAVAGFSMISKKKEYGWTAGIIGLWIFISAFIPALLTGSELSLNGIVAGIIAALAGFFSIGERAGGKTPQTAH